MSTKVTFAGCGDAFGSGGRFNTCFIVDFPERTIAIDFGASSLIALKKLQVDHNSIDTIVCSHIHGDHCGGIPFLIMDAMLGAKRNSPLTIAGPKNIEKGILAMRDALFPGINRMLPKFEIKFVELRYDEEQDVNGLKIQVFPAIHTPETNPTSLRVSYEGKTIAYTGDSEWTPTMSQLARDADLLIAECYFYQKPVRFHLNYPTLKEHWDDLKAKKIVLTHISPEMLSHAALLPEMCASDGLVIEV